MSLTTYNLTIKMNSTRGEELVDFDALQLPFQSADHKNTLNLISKFLFENITNNEISDEKCVSVNQIIQLLLNPGTDNDLKKGIFKCVMKISEKWHPLVLSEISHYLEVSQSANSIDHNEIRHYFENVVVLLGNKLVSRKILVANFLRIASTYEIVIRQLSTNLKVETTKVQENEIADLFHFLIQTMIVFVDESCKCKSIIKFPYSLYESILDLMASNRLNVNTINNCGLLVVALNYNFFDVSSTLLLLNTFSSTSPIQCLAICHGFLASASLEFYISLNSSDLPVLLCDTMWHIYSRYANDSLVIIGLLKIILLFTKKINLENRHVPEKCIECLISLLLSHLDHFLNPAKNLSKEALSQLVQQKNETVIYELLNFVENNRRIDRKGCVILNVLSTAISFSRILTSYAFIVEDLRSATKNAISSNYVCQVYLSLMISDYCDEEIDCWFNRWVEPLLTECSKYDLLLQHILAPVVKLSGAVYKKIIEYCRLIDSSNYSIMVKFLLEMKTFDTNNQSVDDLSNFAHLNLNSHYWKNLLPFDMMTHAVCVPTSTDALTTVSLVVENIKGKDIFTPEEIELLKFFTDSQFAVCKPDFRCKFLNLQSQIFIKISQYLNLNVPSLETKHISRFVDWIIRYSVNNLFPGASYERRHSALSICKILIDRNLWTASFVNTGTMKIFFNSLSDGFEENELLAKHILLGFFSQKSDLVTDADKIDLYREVIAAISGMRFTEHNTAAYVLEILSRMILTKEYLSYIISDCRSSIDTQQLIDGRIRQGDIHLIHLPGLVSKLKSQLNLCKKESITKYPLHGFLHVIRYQLNQASLEQVGTNQSVVDIKNLKILIDNIVNVSLACNEFAVSAVSHSSPEGYLPDEEYEVEVDVFSAAQQTLLCNWRTVKEASLLLGDLVTKLSVGDDLDNHTYLSKKTFLQIGDHLKTIIYQIRHKGSFKQVYIALFQYCKRCWRIPDSDINAVPKQWLVEIEHAIVNNAKQLCLTRRSAGIPCIVLAILCTESDDKRKFTSNLMNKFMESMFKILNDKDAEIESKIHSLNIVRDLFVHKDMAEQINSYVEKAVIIAINGFKSSNWNERNTSNLLLSAILTRIFGVSRSRISISWKNKMTGKIFFQKYPLLFDIFLLHLQQSDHEDVNVQSALYPVLLILARLYPSYHDEWNNTSQLSRFIPYIYSCCGNPIFKIRQLAVQAIIPFITRDIYVEHLHKIWSHVVQPLPENTKHGLLLQLDGLLQDIPELSEEQYENFISLSIRVLLDTNLIFRGSHSFVIKEKLLLILSSLLKRCYNRVDLSIINQYGLNENTSNLPACHLNERSFVKTKDVFNIGLRCLQSMKNNDVTEFICFLESIAQRRTIKPDSVALIDFLVEIILKTEFNEENSILKNFISDDTRYALKETLLKSQIIYNFLLNRLSDDKTYKLFEVLDVLPAFLEISADESAMKLLSSVCEKHSCNSKVIAPLLSCIDILLEKQNSWDRENVFVVKLLLSLYHKLMWDDQRKLRRFFLKFCLCDYLVNDDQLALDVWTFVIGKISSVDEEDFVFLKRVMLKSNTCSFQDNFTMRTLLRVFCNHFQSTPLTSGVGLFSWIIKDLGEILDNVEKNNVFFGDLPDYFEDHLLVCQFASEYLNILLKQNPSIMNEKLTEATLSWIMKQARCEEEKLGITTIREIIDFLVRKFENRTSYRCSIPSNVSFRTHVTLDEQIVRVKLSLLPS